MSRSRSLPATSTAELRLVAIRIIQNPQPYTGIRDGGGVASERCSVERYCQPVRLQVGKENGQPTPSTSDLQPIDFKVVMKKVKSPVDLKSTKTDTLRCSQAGQPAARRERPLVRKFTRPSEPCPRTGCCRTRAARSIC